jgi:hypothetical protein
MYTSPFLSAVVVIPATSDPAVDWRNWLAPAYQYCENMQVYLTIWLCHSQAKSDLAAQHGRQESLLLLCVAKVDHRGSSNGVSTAKCPDNSQVSATSQLINDNKIVKSIPLSGINVAWEPLSIEVICGQGKGCHSRVS